MGEDEILFNLFLSALWAAFSTSALISTANYLQHPPSVQDPSELPDSSSSSCVCLPNVAFSSWKRRIFELEEINYTHTRKVIYLSVLGMGPFTPGVGVGGFTQ